MSAEKKTIFFIRHGEAEHNASKNYRIRDPKLTDRGINQAKKISLPREPTKIFVSPLKRTIQTAIHGFDSAHHHKFCLLPLLQEKEAGQLECDTGSHKADLIKEFPQLTSLIEDLDDDWFQPKMQAKERIVALKQFLLKYHEENSDEVVALVSHYGVFTMWTGNSIKNGQVVEIEI